MSASKKPKGTTKRTRSAAKSAVAKNSSPASGEAPADQTVLICPVEGCVRPYKTGRGLASHVAAKHPDHDAAPKQAPPQETAVEAVERSLTMVTDTPKRAWLVADVRRLADALDLADPTDRPKISKELAVRMADLMAEAIPSDDGDDWTKGAGAAPMGHTPQPEP